MTACTCRRRSPLRSARKRSRRPAPHPTRCSRRIPPSFPGRTRLPEQPRPPRPARPTRPPRPSRRPHPPCTSRHPPRVADAAWPHPRRGRAPAAARGSRRPPRRRARRMPAHPWLPTPEAHARRGAWRSSVVRAAPAPPPSSAKTCTGAWACVHRRARAPAWRRSPPAPRAAWRSLPRRSPSSSAGIRLAAQRWAGPR